MGWRGESSAYVRTRKFLNGSYELWAGYVSIASDPSRFGHLFAAPRDLQSKP